MPNRAEIVPGLDGQVARRILAPLCDRMVGAIADDVRRTGPLDTGALRALVATEPARMAGAAIVVARYVSSRPKDAGFDAKGKVHAGAGEEVDVAAFVEFGTRYMTPRRYSARSAQRSVQRLGYGRFVQSSDPWPHR